MQFLEKLRFRRSEPVIAELWSIERYRVLRIKIYGYENSEDDWLVTDIEYIGPGIEYRVFKWEYDGSCLRNDANMFEVAKRYWEIKWKLLEPPYQIEGLELSYEREVGRYRKGRRDAKCRYYRKRRSGFYISGKIENFTVGFETSWSNVREFLRDLKKASNIYPPRS